MTAKVLLVTAHPDDECMFFLPTIRAYLKQGAEVHILCLSIGMFDVTLRVYTLPCLVHERIAPVPAGDADGLGPVRRQELFHACSLLAVPRDRVIAVDDPNLPDGMRVSWPVSAVSSHIKTVVKRLQPMAVGLGCCNRRLNK